MPSEDAELKRQLESGQLSNQQVLSFLSSLSECSSIYKHLRAGHSMELAKLEPWKCSQRTRADRATVSELEATRRPMQGGARRVLSSEHRGSDRRVLRVGRLRRRPGDN